jgi:uncharacterized protein (DUF1778 family)
MPTPATDARLNLRLTRRQLTLLRKEAERLEITLAEVVRRALDAWLDARTVG